MLKFILITLLITSELGIAISIKGILGEAFPLLAIVFWAINWPLAILILDRESKAMDKGW